MNLRLPRIASPRDAAGGLTGRKVLLILVAFFGVVMVVNVVMVRAAISTFGGVDTPSSYQAGLAFKAEEAAAAEQNARRWQVTATISGMAQGAKVMVAVLDEAGRPVTGDAVVATLAHPIDERRDIVLTLTEMAPGVYSGTAQTEPGQRNLDIEIRHGGERLFRSINRVSVP